MRDRGYFDLIADTQVVCYFLLQQPRGNFGDGNRTVFGIDFGRGMGTGSNRRRMRGGTALRGHFRINLPGTQDGAGIGKRQRDIIDERELAMGDANHIAGIQRVVTAYTLAVYHGTVTAVQVSQRPPALGHEDLGVKATAAFIFDDDLIGRRTADRHRASRYEPKDIGPFCSLANHQVRLHQSAIPIEFRTTSMQSTFCFAEFVCEGSGSSKPSSRHLYAIFPPRHLA